MLNYFNPLVSLVQRANTDISLYTDLQAAVEYLGKYCTKAEVASFSFEETLKALIPIVSSTNQPIIQLAAKAINKIVGGRNWGAQEVCYLLLGLYLQKGTRIVLSVDCRVLSDQGRILALNNNKEVPLQEDFRKGKLYQTKYLKRALQYEDFTFFEALTTCDLGSPRIRALTRGSLRLLSYFPKYKNDPLDSTYEDYCRTQILLLEGLQRTYPTLPVVLDNHSFHRYSDVYRWYRQHYIDHPNIYLAPLQKLSRKVQARIDAEDFEERLVQEDKDPAYQNDLNNARLVQAQHNPNALGNRQIDIHADQMLFVGKYIEQWPTIYNYPGRDYQKEEITANPAELRIDLQSTGQKELLNSEQRLLYNTVIYYFESMIAGRNLPQILLNVNGRAGTGKSYIIRLILAHLQSLAQRTLQLRRAPVLRLALIGVAVYAINGQILYKLLKLPTRSIFEELSVASLQTVQADLASINYLIINEKSIISLSQLKIIELRLLQALYSSRPFGGINIVLCRDFF